MTDTESDTTVTAGLLTNKGRALRALDLGESSVKTIAYQGLLLTFGFSGAIVWTTDDFLAQRDGHSLVMEKSLAPQYRRTKRERELSSFSRDGISRQLAHQDDLN